MNFDRWLIGNLDIQNWMISQEATSWRETRDNFENERKS